MKKLLLALITFYLILRLFVGCGFLSPTPIVDLLLTWVEGQPAPPTSIPVTGEPGGHAQAVVKTSLVLSRGGKTYEVVIGYAQNGQAGVNRAELIWQGDFDQDGETEYIVAQQVCREVCAAELYLYEYNPSGDRYFAAGKLDPTGLRDL